LKVHVSDDHRTDPVMHQTARNFDRSSRSAATAVVAVIRQARTTTASFIGISELSGVQVDPSGDFRIDDTLNPILSECPSPALLIRNVADGQWFAAGIPELGDDD
jgi:hypothetical protein